LSDTDQGNRYELAGIVAGLRVLAPLEKVHPSLNVVPLPSMGLGLVPVTGEVAAAVTPAMICVLPEAVLPPDTARATEALVTGPESGFTRLTTGLLALVEAASSAGPVGYLETEYTGRDGSQTAAVWHSGVLVLGPLILGRSELYVPREAPISQALRMLGVPGDARRDEFVVAGLGRFRRTEDWVSG
jgi:hypothetical protein